MRIKVCKNKFVSTVLIVFFVFGLFSFNTFEGGSCAGVTWTYNPSTNTATASGTGTTNFAELVQADIAGGWGGVYTADASGTQISCGGKIVIGDGNLSTVFVDTNKQVIFLSTVRTGANQVLISVSASSTLTLGTLVDDTTKKTNNGCQIYDLGQNANYYGYMIKPSSTSAVINIFSSSFQSPNGSLTNWVQATKCYNCLFDGIAYIRYDTYTSGDLFNVVISGSGYGVRLYGNAGNISLNKIDILTKGQAFHFQRITGDCTIKDAYVRMSGGTNYCYRMESTGAYDVYLINVDSNTWNGIWTGNSTGKVFRQYTFNLNVLNGEITAFVKNATVQLWKDSNLIYEGVTNSSGMIPTQTLTYGFYQQSTGDAIQNATSPYYLVISHPDWQTYVSRFYITEPLRLTVSMQDNEGEGVGVEAVAFGVVVFVVVGVFVLLALFVRRRGSSGFG